MKFRQIIFFTLMYTFLSFSAHAQVDTIRPNDKKLLMSFLKLGLNQYLVYRQNFKSPKILGTSFWFRNIEIKERNGERVFIIDQHWFGADTSRYYKIYSINKAENFEPIFHAYTALDTTYAFNWHADKIKGADTILNNPEHGFSLKFAEPNFNWNLDIELFEMLPLNAGKTFAINFYDAGLEPPQFVIYKVIGSEEINTYSNQQVDCWKLRTEGNNQGHHSTETYWISKKAHEFLKEEDDFDGGHRYKIKMPNLSPNPLLRQIEYLRAHAAYQKPAKIKQ
jgi:hypothetical protein